jgi:hypothetical protein
MVPKASAKERDTNSLLLVPRICRSNLFELSPKKKTQKIEENMIMNPAILLGTAFKIA